MCDKLNLIDKRYVLPDGRWYDPSFDYGKLKELIRADVLSDGVDVGSFVFEVEVDRRLQDWEGFKTQLSYRDACRLIIGPMIKVVNPNIGLDIEEIEYIVDKLEGVNNPVGARILNKLKLQLIEKQ